MNHEYKQLLVLSSLSSRVGLDRIKAFLPFYTPLFLEIKAKTHTECIDIIMTSLLITQAAVICILFFFFYPQSYR